MGSYKLEVGAHNLEKHQLPIFSGAGVMTPFNLSVVTRPTLFGVLFQFLLGAGSLRLLIPVPGFLQLRVLMTWIFPKRLYDDKPRLTTKISFLEWGSHEDPQT